MKRHVEYPMLPESRRIPANDRCPHPERWHSSDDDSTELEVSELVAALVRALQPNLVIETGSAFGQTTELIVKALIQNGAGQLITFEIDANRAAKTRARVGIPEDVVWTLREEDTMTWAVNAAPWPIDLVFSDTYGPIRIPEVMRLFPYLRKDATVVFHDTAPEPDFPFRAMIEEQLVVPGHMKVVDLPTPRGVSICQFLAS